MTLYYPYLERSLPVPRGKTPTGGGGSIVTLSKTDKSHPTVPSPPHAEFKYDLIFIQKGFLKPSYQLDVNC